MGSIRVLRKGFFWLIDRLEEISSALRLKDIIQRFLDNKSIHNYAVEFCILLGSLLCFEFAAKQRDKPNEMIGLDLNDASSQSEEPFRIREFSNELAYFLEILKRASRPRAGECEMMECFICPVRGNRLFRPPDRVLETLKRVVSERRVKISYYLIFEKADLGHLDPEEVDAFLQVLGFAQISFIIMDAEFRERFAMPKRSFINRVTFANQQIAFTHNRDHYGIFTGAREYSGVRARRIFQMAAKLRLLATNCEAIELGNGLRMSLQRFDSNSATSSELQRPELPTEVDSSDRTN